MRKLACDGLVVSFNRPGGNFLQRAGEDRLSPLTVLWDAAPTICNLLGTCCLFNLVPTFPQSSPFQAWGLDPRKRRDAHGHAPWGTPRALGSLVTERMRAWLKPTTEPRRGKLPNGGDGPQSSGPSPARVYTICAAPARNGERSTSAAPGSHSTISRLG